jgi:hypothetical protein
VVGHEPAFYTSKVGQSRERVLIVFGATAVVVGLLGLAFGAGRRRQAQSAAEGATRVGLSH